MTWVNPSTRASGYTVTATNWNELVNNFKHLMVVNHTQFTADVNVTATTVGTANQIVSAGAVTYENVPHLIEFYCSRVNSAAGICNLILRDSTTVLGTFTQFPVSQVWSGGVWSYRVTPTAASHTYNVAAFTSTPTWTFKAGSGGAAGDATTFFPGYIRITRDPV